MEKDVVKTIIEKIKKRKKALGMTNKQLSELSEVSEGTLNKILGTETKDPSISNILKITEALGLSDAYVFGSTPPVFAESEINHIKKYRALDEHGKDIIDTILSKEYDRCSTPTVTPVIHLKHSIYKASAGFGFDLEDRDEWDEIDIPDTPEAQKADFAVTIKGNSMEPIYSDGDIVLVEKCDTVNIGETGIFIVNGSGFIKQYGGDRLISINSDYDDIIFTEGDFIKCAGKVIGTV